MTQAVLIVEKESSGERDQSLFEDGKILSESSDAFARTGRGIFSVSA